MKKSNSFALKNITLFFDPVISYIYFYFLEKKWIKKESYLSELQKNGTIIMKKSNIRHEIQL